MTSRAFLDVLVCVFFCSDVDDPKAVTLFFVLTHFYLSEHARMAHLRLASVTRCGLAAAFVRVQIPTFPVTKREF
jgi:hypothetical protein